MKRILASVFIVVLGLALMLGGKLLPLQSVHAASGELTVHMVNVQGAGFIVQLPNNKVMVVDSGVGDSTNRQIMFDKLDALGITHIDYLVGTHHHSDHIGNHNNILNNYSVGEVIFPKYSPTSSTDYIYMESAANAHNVPIRKVDVGDRIFPTTTVDGKELKTLVYAPQGDGIYDDDIPEGKDNTWLANAYSLVFHIKYGDQGVVFTGDARDPTMADVISAYPLDNIQVYVAAHHGDNDEGNDDPILNYINPIYALIPQKTDDKQGFKTRLETHNITYWSTKYEGTVYLKTDGISWTAEKTAEWTAP